MKVMHGFSLVELSIVLVILGLLTGGILSGQSLIRAGQLRSVTTEYERFFTAVNGFKDQYQAIPGDMKDATAYWGTAANCPGTSAQGSTGSVTCDGNGDGYVFASAGSNEHMRFWQHLANADLIEGQYNGVTADSGGYEWSPGTANSPASKLSKAYWSITTFDNVTAAGTAAPAMFQIRYYNAFYFGGLVNAHWNRDLVLSGKEAWKIDTKMDDGKPGQGLVTAKWQTCTNAANNGVLSADYAVSTSDMSCWMAFNNDFE